MQKESQQKEIMTHHPLLLPRQIDAEQYAGSTQQGHGRQRFAQKNQGADGRENRVQIQIIGSADGTQPLEDEVPHHEASQRSQHTKEQQVHPDDRPRERLQRKLPGTNHEGGKYGEQAIKENLAGNEDRGVSLGHLTHNQAIESPAKGSRQREYVTQGRELQHKIAVEDDQSYAQQGQQRTAHQPLRGPLAPIEKPSQQQGKQGRAAHNEGHVRGERHTQRRILRQEVERTARHTCQQHPALVLPRAAQQRSWRDEPDAHVGNEEA